MQLTFKTDLINDNVYPNFSCARSINYKAVYEYYGNIIIIEESLCYTRRLIMCALTRTIPKKKKHAVCM